ncbi:MAG: CAP domain-containing protein [Bacteroides sp.]|nr:CAP domain-containing protein [Bacteroides sp.]
MKLAMNRPYKKIFALIFLIYLLLPGKIISAQNTVWDQWDAGVIDELFTSRDIPYMNEEEQKVILFMNMARHDGPLFADTFVKLYVEEEKIAKNSYLKSLYRDLKKVAGLTPLIPEEDLTSVAQGHATKSGKSGHVGHKNMDKRFAPLEGNPYLGWAENCSYGYQEALSIVVTLLIDDGIKGLGHRKNILNESYNSVGVAIRPHKSYRVNCVMDFGNKSRSQLNTVPY